MERARGHRLDQQDGAEPGPWLASSRGATVSWKKSSWSAHNGNCVEIAALPANTVGVRDSKDANSPVLIFDHDAWRQFLADVKNVS